MLTDDDLKAELTRLEPFEGRVPWAYLDTKGLVTTGVGYLLHDLAAMQALPWHHGIDGLPAAPDEVAAEWARLQRLPAGKGAAFYKGPLRLAPEDIDAEGFRRLRAFVAGLTHLFPGYDGFPESVQQALLDLGWNCGTGPQLPGLGGWHGLLACCNSVPPDWAGAVDQCTTANPTNIPTRAIRNRWRQQCFKLAALGQSQPTS
jgi:hypothetical protein